MESRGGETVLAAPVESREVALNRTSNLRRQLTGYYVSGAVFDSSHDDRIMSC